MLVLNRYAVGNRPDAGIRRQAEIRKDLMSARMFEEVETAGKKDVAELRISSR